MPIARLVVISAFLFFKINVPLVAVQKQLPDSLSQRAEISLITGAPGEALYTRWGHSAIRVKDPVLGIDIVYNYGTFDFRTSGFYMKFMRGKLKYFVSRYEFRRMVAEYKYFDQTLKEQVLNLTHKEKIEVFNFLNTNYLPENRYYLYDFFYDNCSSRIRDVFKNILGEKLIFRDDYLTQTKTMRDLLDDFIERQTPWGDFGIDLVLGIPADKIATSWNHMFLPYEMHDAFEHAVIIRDGEEKPFVKSENVIYQQVNGPSTGTWLDPVYLFYVLLLIIIFISILEIRKKIHLKIIDVMLFSIIGLAGVIIGFLWFFTDHIATKDNLNFLWASPLHLFSAYLIMKNSLRRFSSYYFLFWSIFLTLLLIGWNYIPQNFHVAIIPIILIMIVRSFLIYQLRKK